MKKMVRVLLIFISTCLICFTAQAAEDFETGWTSYTDSGTWTTVADTTELTASVTGTPAWGNYSKTFTGAVGAVATFNASVASGTGAAAGLRKTVGTMTSGNNLLVELYLQTWGGDFEVICRLIERNPSTSATIRTISRSYIGNSGETEWAVDTDITIGFGIVDNVVYFFGSNQDDIIGKIELQEKVTVSDNSLEVYGWSEGDGALDFVCSNLNVAYSLPELLGYMGFPQTYTVYIPHVTGGFSDWKDVIQVDNDSSAQASFTITLYDSTGAQVYNEAHTVDGLTRSKDVIELKTLTGASDAQFGMITYTDTGLLFRLSQENLNGGGLAEFVLEDMLTDDLGFYFSDFSTSTQWKGIALSNIGATGGVVTLSAIGGGAVLKSVNVFVAAYQKVLGLYGDFFPQVVFEDLDAIVVTSSLETLCGVAISGDNSNSKLLFTSGVPLE